MHFSSMTDDDFYRTQNLFKLGIGDCKFFHAIEKELPPVFDRQTASKTIGNLITVKTMCNDDSRGVGPKESVYIGKRKGYTRESFLEYLKNKIRNY